MKKTILFSALVIGLALTGCNKATKSDTVATDTTARPANSTATPAPATSTASDDLRRAANNAGSAMERAGDKTADAMRRAGDNISAKLTEWRLSASDIEADLTADRPIVRTKETAGAPTGTIDKSTLQSAVEAKIKADSELANLKLDVNADRKGEIQLEGKALTASQVARAIGLALDTDGVSKVTSKVKLDKDAVKN
jgi:hypothetical protein